MPSRRPALVRPGLPALLALYLVVATVVGACSLSVGRGKSEWSQSSTSADGTSHEVNVSDTSGRITNVEFDPPGAQGTGSISNPGGNLNVLLVPWTGGACDVSTAINFAAAGQGLKGTIATKTSGQVCIMIAIQHMLRITLNTPTPAASVTLERAAVPGG